MFHANLSKFGEFPLGTISEFDKTFTICLDHWETLKISAFFMKGVLRYTFRNFDLIQLQGDFFCFGPFLKAYNSVGNQGINQKFYGLNNRTIDLQKTDIWENLIFTWLPDWMSKIIKIWKYKHNKYTKMIHKNDT